MKRRLALCAFGLTLAGCNSNTMGFNALSDPGFPWGVFVAGAVVGAVLTAVLAYLIAAFGRGMSR